MTTTPNPPIQPTLKVRRPITSHVFHAAWIALTLYQTIDSGFPARMIWGLLFLYAVALAVRAVLKPQVLELTGTKLTIYGDFFRSKTVDITDIDRIEIEAGPFSNSKVVLKGNKRHVKFNYYRVRNNDFDALLKELNVPVR